MTLDSFYLGDAPFVKSAITYASRGQPVFPLRSASKQPIPGLKWKRDATTSEETIAKWWGRSPLSNVGVVTGRPSNLLAVDVDPRHGGSLDTLEEMCGRFSTPIVRTGGGGWHLYFQYPRIAVDSRTILDGIEVKSDRHYLVGVGSIHPNGNAYSWLDGFSPDDMPLSMPPDALVELLLTQPKMSQFETFEGNATLGSRYWLGWALRRAEVGTRHPTAIHLGLQLHDNQVPRDEANSTAVAYASGVPEPDTYSEADALACIAWAYSLVPRPPSRGLRGPGTHPLLTLSTPLLPHSVFPMQLEAWETEAMEADSMPRHGSLKGKGSSPAKVCRQAQRQVVVSLVNSLFPGIPFTTGRENQRLTNWFTLVTQAGYVGYEANTLVRFILNCKARMPHEDKPIAYIDKALHNDAGREYRPGLPQRNRPNLTAYKAQLSGAHAKPVP